jgi:hypothetical protein
MCLDTVTEKIEPVALIESGWKTFNHSGETYNSGEKLRFRHYSFAGTKEVPTDKWITAEGKEISMSRGNYPAGFHVYSDEKQKASNWRRIYYRNVQARGHQDGKMIVIAREIYVPTDPDGWPPK